MRNKGNRFNDSTSFSYIQYMNSTIYVLVREVVAGTEVRTAVLNSQHQWLHTVVIILLIAKTVIISFTSKQRAQNKKG